MTHIAKCPFCDWTHQREGAPNDRGHHECACCGKAFSPQWQEQTESCPFCSEPISAAALKCKHCGEHFAASPCEKTIGEAGALKNAFAGNALRIFGLLFLLAAIVVVLVGGKYFDSANLFAQRPTEAEFYALKEANDAHLEWIQKWGESLRTGEPVSTAVNINKIMDGAIIRSDLGKKIRLNLQASLVIYTGLVSKEGAEMVSLQKKLIEKQTEMLAKKNEISSYSLPDDYADFWAAIRELEALEKEVPLLASEMAERAKFILAKVKELEPELDKLQQERDQMFKQMREVLEN